MTTSFVYSAGAARVVFGRGTIGQLGAEVERLGAHRVFVVHGPRMGAEVDRAAEVLGASLAGRFGEVAMHVPVEVSERAVEAARAAGADCVVSIGGGSSTGLGKAVALRGGWPLVAVPTTYAGSEVTPVLGETADGVKTTQTSPAVVPKAVVYDVDLTLGLPVALSVTSGVNAMAHAVEALYSAQANPATDQSALEAIRRIGSALPRIAADPSDVEARTDALIGAWLAGTCLGTVGMGLHHKLCHTLGGSFGLPHAQTHTVILPQAMAYNAAAAVEPMRRIAGALGRADAPAATYDLIVSLGGPTSLAELGFAATDIPRAAELATAAPYPNPREVTVAGVVELLGAAFEGRRPAPSAQGRLTDEVVDSFAGAKPRVRELLGSLVQHLHHFAVDHDLTQQEWAYAIDFLTRTGQISNDKRQEFVLLSDTLGVSSIVDQLTNSRTPDTTPSAVLGPFYVEGPPAAEQGADISGGLSGTPLWTDVAITDLAGSPLAGATVDVWQSNDDGFYDVQLPELEGPVLRARFTSDDAGRVRFWSILPSQYPIPVDGPVGQMLTETGRHPYRAPHLHFMISASGYKQLITQLFVAGGAYLDSDTVFGVKPELIVDFAPGEGEPPAGRVVENGAWRHLTFSFRVASSS